MRQYGFTLIEQLFSVSILSILISLGIPSLSEQITKNKTRVAVNELLTAINSTRTLAVATNRRAILKANEKWQDGWVLFQDLNDNGIQDENEPVSFKQEAFTKVKIHANKHLENYISFIGTGEGRKVGRSNGGAFQVGTIQVCPAESGEGYALILSRGGRTRIEKLKATECDKTRKK